MIIEIIKQFLDRRKNFWRQEFLAWENGEEIGSLNLDREDFWGEETNFY